MAKDCEAPSGGARSPLAVFVVVKGFFEEDDPAGRLQSCPLVGHLPGLGGHAQPIAGLAAVSVGRTERDEQLRLIQATQEVWQGADHVRSAGSRPRALPPSRA